MAHTFSDSYVFAWMRRGAAAGSPRSLTELLGDLTDPSVGVRPGFLATFPTPRRLLTLAFRRRMRQCVPPWLWERTRFAAFHYHRFFSCLWPDLAARVEPFVFLEWLLYMEPDPDNHYRDHLFHMFKVACMGSWFLEDPVFGQEVAALQFPAAGDPAERQWVTAACRNLHLTSQDKLRVVQSALLLAALLHDFGYGYCFRAKIDRKVDSLYEWMASLTHNTEPSTATQRLWDESLTAEFVRRHISDPAVSTAPGGKAAQRRIDGFVRDTLPLGHGTASCLLLLHLSELLSQARQLTPLLGLAFQMAAEAALIHDMTGPIDKDSWCGLQESSLGDGHFLTPASYQEAPLAIVLALCDELDCWNRPRLRHRAGASPKQATVHLAPAPPKSITVSISPTALSIRMRGGTAALTAKLRDHLQDLHAFQGTFFGRTIQMT